MQKLCFVCISQVLLCKSQVRHAKARFVMQKLGFAQLSCYIPATSMVYRPFCGYPSLFKSQYIIIFQCVLCKLCWSRGCFTMFRPRQWFIDPLVVIHPYVSRHTWLFSMHSVQLLLVHTLWDAMHACLYRLQALCHRYDMGSWVGGCF